MVSVVSITLGFGRSKVLKKDNKGKLMQEKRPVFTKKISLALVCLVSGMSPLVQAASVDELEQRIQQLERLLKHQAQQIDQQAKQLESIKRTTIQEIKYVKEKTAEVAASSKGQKSPQPLGVTIYGSIRPALTVAQDERINSSSTDVTDFLSRVGIKSERIVSDDLTAFVQGEWDVDIEADGDFGDARLAFAGLKGSWGTVGLGKQWNPHHNIVAIPTDIFNHRDSPFGYNEQGPFRTNNLLTYTQDLGNFHIETGLQFNGDVESPLGGDRSETTEPNNVDSGSFGVAYQADVFSVGTSYLQQNGDNDFERSFIGVSASWNVTDALYLAVSYQDIETENSALSLDDDLDGDSLDIVASYAFGNGYKLKTGFFDFDDGLDLDDVLASAGALTVDDLRSQDGYNLTLERQFNENLRVFAEWLHRDFDDTDEIDSLSVGVRYDFSTTF